MICYHWSQQYRMQFICPDNCLRIVTPLVPEVWNTLLIKHPDREFVEYLMRGLRGGFHV